MIIVLTLQGSLFKLRLRGKCHQNVKTVFFIKLLHTNICLQEGKGEGTINKNRIKYRAYFLGQFQKYTLHINFNIIQFYKIVTRLLTRINEIQMSILEMLTSLLISDLTYLISNLRIESFSSFSCYRTNLLNLTMSILVFHSLLGFVST